MIRGCEPRKSVRGQERMYQCRFVVVLVLMPIEQIVNSETRKSSALYMFGLVDGYVLPQNKKPARRITLAIHLSLTVLFPLFIYYLNQWTSIDSSPVSPVDNRSLAPNHCKFARTSRIAGQSGTLSGVV